MSSLDVVKKRILNSVKNDSQPLNNTFINKIEFIKEMLHVKKFYSCHKCKYYILYHVILFNFCDTIYKTYFTEFPGINGYIMVSSLMYLLCNLL